MGRSLSLFARAKLRHKLHSLNLQSRLAISAKIAARLTNSSKVVLPQKRRCARLHKLQLKGKRQPRPRRWWVRPMLQPRKRKGAWYDLIPDLRKNDPEQFYKFFAMSVASFDKLLGLVEKHLIKRSWRQPIPPGERLAIALRYYVSGDKYTSLSFLFRVSNQAISNIVHEVSTVLWAVLEPLVFEPVSEEFWLRVAAEYEALWNFPHCCGALDGKHFMMKNPAWAGSRFYNYKTKFSQVLMGLADAKRKFIFVDVGASGRRGDSDIFNASSLGKKLAEGRLLPPSCHFEGIPEKLPFVIIGDGAFEKRPNLVNPFSKKKGLLPPPLRVFNSRFSKARHCIEDAFGIMYKRYQVFDRPIEATRTTVRVIVLACCALHNFHLLDEESVPPRKVRNNEHLYYDYVHPETNKVIRGRYRNENKEEEEMILERLKTNVADAKIHHQPNEKQLTGGDIREILLDYFIDYPTPGQWRKAKVDK